jgi:hypothetical protein
MSITVAQFLFTALTCLFYTKCNRLKARVVIYAYNQHVRLLSPEPLVFDKPQSTRSEEPTLLCNHVGTSREFRQLSDLAGTKFIRLYWRKTL